jgi:hypothetical protein
VLQAADDAENAEWWSIFDVPDVAFDHKLVLHDCFVRASHLPAARLSGMSDALRSAAERLTGRGSQ